MQEIVNRKARFDYTFLETFTAGISLLGSEVKSIQEGGVTMVDSYCIIHDGEVWVKSLNISIRLGSFQHDPSRDKKLLLKKREIRKLQTSLDKGVTIVPVKMFRNQRGRIKMEIALAKGKKNYDKRNSIKEREIEREMRRNDD